MGGGWGREEEGEEMMLFEVRNGCCGFRGVVVLGVVVIYLFELLRYTCLSS